MAVKPKWNLPYPEASKKLEEYMISTNMYKAFEYCLLQILKNFADLSRYQFGYRENTSTLLATSLLKEALGKYINNDSTVYACFLDMSKAYERVDHDKLMEKLKSKHYPRIISYLIQIIQYNSADLSERKDIKYLTPSVIFLFQYIKYPKWCLSNQTYLTDNLWYLDYSSVLI